MKKLLFTLGIFASFTTMGQNAFTKRHVDPKLSDQLNYIMTRNYIEVPMCGAEIRLPAARPEPVVILSRAYAIKRLSGTDSTFRFATELTMPEAENTELYDVFSARGLPLLVPPPLPKRILSLRWMFEDM